MEINVIKILQIIALQGIFLSFYHWYLSRRVDFHFARMYLLFTLGAAMLVPLMPLSLASDLGLVGRYYLPEINITGVDQLSLNLTSLSLDQLLLVLYFVVATVAVIKFLGALIRILHVIMSSPKTKSQNYYLINTTKVATSSFGPFLFWNPNPALSAEECQLIKQHEESHIKEWHSVDILLAEVMAILLWFNPLAYLYKNAMAQNHEFIADQYSADTKKKAYAQLLLKEALGAPSLSFTSHFNRINTNRRIMELSKSNNRISKPIHYLLTLLALVLTVTAVSLSTPVQAQQLADNSQTSDDKVYLEVDQLPKYSGGMKALVSELQKTLIYPTEAKKAGTEGKVFVGFVVSKTGEVTEVAVEKGLTKLCDEAAVAAVAQLPNWEPGVHKGQIVNVKLVLPINFELDDVEEGQ
ncbi:MAG: M56 family metallopeptidase [Cyclobacteriaceae bacterium]